MIVVAIKDSVAGEFGDLGTYKNKELAVRAFDEICSRSPFRGDLQLFKVGEFDPDSGAFLPDLLFIKNGVIENGKVQL